jgi:hypothetical protein
VLVVVVAALDDLLALVSAQQEDVPLVVELRDGGP